MKTVEEIIEESLDELVKIANEEETQQKNKLIFPKYSNGIVRISEQEARFLFVEKVIKDYDGFFSVETPTKFKYRFSEGGNKLDIPLILEEGKSGNIDVCLYDKDKNLRHLIEFKAHISEQSEINKDFLKLKYDNTITKLSNYFVHILPSYDSGTIEGLKKRYKKAFDLNENRIENDITIFVCMLKVREYNTKNIISFQLKNYEEELEKFLNKK